MLVLLEIGVGFSRGLPHLPARRSWLPGLRVLRGTRGGTDPWPGRAVRK